MLVAPSTSPQPLNSTYGVNVKVQGDFQKRRALTLRFRSLRSKLTALTV